MSQPSSSIPKNDPATRRVMPLNPAPIDKDKAARLLAAEWDRFTASTGKSGEHNVRASKSLPLGVTSSFQHWDPYPISIASAKGAWLTDVDGRQLLDLSMGFGAMLFGHLNPVLVQRAQQPLTRARKARIRRVAHPLCHSILRQPALRQRGRRGGQ